MKAPKNNIPGLKLPILLLSDILFAATPGRYFINRRKDVFYKKHLFVQYTCKLLIGEIRHVIIKISFLTPYIELSGLFNSKKEITSRLIKEEYLPAFSNTRVLFNYPDRKRQVDKRHNSVGIPLN